MSEGTICLVGAGNMGGAMLGGWLEAGRDPASITVLDPNPPEPYAKLMAEHGVAWHVSADDLDPPDLIIVAVKPQIIMGANLTARATSAWANPAELGH